MRFQSLSLAVAILFHPCAAFSATIDVLVAEDASVFYRSDLQGLATTNFGTIHNYAGGFEPGVTSYSRSVMKFNLPAIPGGQSLQSAILELWVGQEFPTLGVYDFHNVDDNWTEGSVTWLSAPQPNPGQPPIATFVNSLGIAGVPATTRLQFDITPAAQSEYGLGQAAMSILFKEHDENGTTINRVRAHSKETGAIGNFVPKLVLNTVPEPAGFVLAVGLGLALVAARRRVARRTP